jgi:radical SAM superfamily enzyme with C-terminal helix-hairpin-helix motif
MGANKATSGPGGGNNKTYSSSREIGLMNRDIKDQKQRAIKTQQDKNEAFREQGAYNTRRSLDKLPSLLPGAAILKGLSKPLQENSRKTRKFFTDKVLTDPRGLKNFGVNKKQFESLSVEKQNQIYNNYITTRRDNKTDGYGTVIKEGNDNQVVQAPLVATKMPGVTLPPTTSEVSQSAATDAAEDSLILRKRKTKARGRSPTIMTGVTGVTGSLTLGKPSLLGR